MGCDSYVSSFISVKTILLEILETMLGNFDSLSNRALAE